MSVGHTETSSGQVLGQYLPEWDFREVHSRRIDAPASEVRDALLALTPRDLPLSGVMLALRLLPAIVVRRRWPLALDRPWFELLSEYGFVELRRTDDEFALGAVGQFWRLREEMEPVAHAEAFGRFDTPGFAKAAMDFRILESADHVTLVTETRVRATDDRARRSFRPYWVPVRAVGGLMRRELLAAVARRAERRARARPV